MTPYELRFSREATDDLSRLDKSQVLLIIKKLKWVAANAEEVRHEALTGQWAGYYRWRIGDYRAIYELDTLGKLIIIAVIGHRRQIYDDF